MIGMNSPTMLYRKGTMERLHKVHVDWTIVDESQVDSYLDEGWFRTPTEAGAEEHAPSAYTIQQQGADLEAREQNLDDREQRLADAWAELDRQRDALAAAQAATQASAKPATKKATPAESDKQPAQ